MDQFCKIFCPVWVPAIPCSINSSSATIESDPNDNVLWYFFVVDEHADLRPKGRGRPQRILLGYWPEDHIQNVIRAVVFRDPQHIKDEPLNLGYPRLSVSICNLIFSSLYESLVLFMALSHLGAEDTF